MYRFAPLNAKDISIEDLQVALFSYICSTQKKLSLHLRINDVSENKSATQETQKTLELLRKFKIKHSQPLFLSHNLKFYRQFAMKLLSEKKAYACFCSKEKLQKKKELAKKENRPYMYDGECKKLTNMQVLNNEQPFVIRIIKPQKSLSFLDTVYGKLSFEPNEIDDFIILDYSKYPTYNFACAIDDMLYNTTHIIKNQKHVLDTAKQIHIRSCLGYDVPLKYTHLPLLIDTKNKKLDNYTNFSNVTWLVNEGYLPEAIINYLILLGNKTPKKIFTLNEAIQWFDLRHISKNSMKFDVNQLRDINKQHIELLDDKMLSSLIGYSNHNIGKLAKLYAQEEHSLNEIKSKIDSFFEPRKPESKNEKSYALLSKIIKEAPYLEDFDIFKNYLSKRVMLNDKDFSKQLRYILTGTFRGPKLEEIYPIIKHFLKEIKI